MEAREILREEQREGYRKTVLDEAFTQALVRKWNRLVGDIKNPEIRKNTAILLENQMENLKLMQEDTRSANVGEFTKYIFPLVRRIWPNLIANEIVSVQPMTAPVGAVFYYEYKIGTTKGTSIVGQNLIENLNRYYSSDFIEYDNIGTGDGSTTTFTDTLDFQPVQKGTFTIKAGAVVGTDDGNGNIVGAGIASGTINYVTGAVSVTFTSAPGSGVDIFATYRYDMEMNEKIPQINVALSMSEVRAKPRKLKTIWSPEASEDLRAFHGIDLESEIVAGMASEIALELDREIINDIMTSVTDASLIDTFDMTIPTGVLEIYHIRSLLTKLGKISNRIHKATLRGPANWIITSTDISSLITQLSTHGDFRPVFAPEASPHGSPVEQVGLPGYGIYKAGVLQNRWTVYVDPYFPADVILLGLKGRTFLDAGYVYAPYVPLQVTLTLFDPNDFSAKKGMRTRYATKLINNKFYGKVIVTNLP